MTLFMPGSLDPLCHVQTVEDASAWMMTLQAHVGFGCVRKIARQGCQILWLESPPLELEFAHIVRDCLFVWQRLDYIGLQIELMSHIWKLLCCTVHALG